MEKRRGRFIVLEGIDGSGKSTQAKMLERLLKKSGKKTFLTHEPSRKTGLGRHLTKLTKKGGLSKKEWISLFTKEREQHIKEEILPCLKKSRIVLADRYYYSTLAYQLPENKWKSYARRLLRPDLTLILDVPAKIAMKRIEKSRKHREKAVFERLAFLKKLRAKYLKMKAFREVRIIDASQSPKEVFERIKKEFEK
jgi:dTMP kinase